jgi:hypothetical protein
VNEGEREVWELMEATLNDLNRSDFTVIETTQPYPLARAGYRGEIVVAKEDRVYLIEIGEADDRSGDYLVWDEDGILTGYKQSDDV